MVDSLVGIISFCVVFLLLGLLVTCLVQAIQNVANWRAKLLKKGLNQLARHLVATQNSGDENALAHLLQQLTEPQLPQSSYLPKAFLAQINYLSIADINRQVVAYFSALNPLESQEKATLEAESARYFARLETEMSLSFRAKTHLASFVCAALLAFSFQINVFTLAENAVAHTVSETPISFIGEHQAATRPHFSLLPHGIAYFYKVSTQAPQKSDAHPSFSALLSAWLGVIFAAIFISLGAPFWYQKIHSLLTLKAELSAAK